MIPSAIASKVFFFQLNVAFHSKVSKNVIQRGDNPIPYRSEF